MNVGVGPNYESYRAFVRDKDFNQVFFRMSDGYFYVKGKHTETIRPFQYGSTMFILFDGSSGSIKYFENDIERKHIDLGNDFVDTDMFFTVQFGCKDNQVDIVNREEPVME